MIGAAEIARRVLGNKYALGALLCLAVLSGIWIYGETRWRAGYAAYEAEIAEGAAEAERARVQDDTQIKGLSDLDLCRRYLRSRGLPDEACEQLRGLP